MAYVFIENIYVKGGKYLGTALRITVILNIDTADSVSITIEDPYDTAKVDAQAMSKKSNKVYTYTWQSHEDDDEEGDYSIIIQATSGSDTALDKKIVTLEDPDLGVS